MKLRLSFLSIAAAFLLVINFYAPSAVGVDDFTTEYISSLAPGCVAAAAWADVQGEELPRLYSDFSRFPSHYQRATFRQLTPAERLTLFTTNFAVRYDIIAALNEDEEAYARDVLRSMTTELFTIPELGGLEVESHFAANGMPAPKDIIEAIGLENTYALFVSVRAPDYLPEAPAPSASAAPGDCECSAGGGDFCIMAGHNLECEEGADNCAPSTWGCGWLFLFDCDGKCKSTL